MKNKYKYMFLTLIMSSCLLSGCTFTSSSNDSSKPTNTTNNTSKTVESEKAYFPFTGEDMSANSTKNLPVLAIVENSKDARPQSGLNKADIVYETMAEGGIPRFIALFQKNANTTIGPIRSARPYFLDIAKEYDLPFAHCGASEEAENIIESDKLMSMNEMPNGSYYFRDSSRKSPHNLYTTTEKLRSLAVAKGFDKAYTSPLKFDDNFWKNSDFGTANSVNLKLNKYYSTSYTYKNGHYEKSMDGSLAVDKIDNTTLSAHNIVVQLTSIKLQSDMLHLDIKLVGEGDAYVISDGKFLKVKWSKKDANSKTILLDTHGKEVPLSKGRTWWHIVDSNNLIEIK